MSQARDRLAKRVNQPKKVYLTRVFPGDPSHSGFVLALGRDLVLLHQFHDFYPEGYTALRVADIKRVRSGEHERFWDRMIQGEGLMEQVGIAYELPLDDYQSLLIALHERGQCVIVECESPTTAEYDDFFIGRVVALDDDSVSILTFDAMGQWDDQPSIIAYEDITQIQFDTPYINTMTKYLKEPPLRYGLDAAPE